MLWRVAEEVEAEIKLVERELAEAKRGARAEELAAVRDILYGDKWFRIATTVYTQIMREFAEDAKAGELLEAARSRLFGLRLEVVEAPMLKIEVAVDREGKMAAVRCRASLDVGVEAVCVGAAPGYRLEEAAQEGKTAGAGAEAAEKTATGAEAVVERRGGGEEADVERKDAAGRGGELERVLEEVRWEFSGLPVYVGVEESYVKRTAPMDKRQFRRCLETCRRLGFRLDRGSSRWRSYSHLQRYKPATAGRTPFMDRLAEAATAHLCRHRSVGLFRLTPGVGSPR